jgi:hypothetical protein
MISPLAAPLQRLQTFRQNLLRIFPLPRDALFELIEAEAEQPDALTLGAAPCTAWTAPSPPDRRPIPWRIGATSIRPVPRRPGRPPVQLAGADGKSRPGVVCATRCGTGDHLVYTGGDRGGPSRALRRDRGSGDGLVGQRGRQWLCQSGLFVGLCRPAQHLRPRAAGLQSCLVLCAHAGRAPPGHRQANETGTTASAWGQVPLEGPTPAATTSPGHARRRHGPAQCLNPAPLQGPAPVGRGRAPGRVSESRRHAQVSPPLVAVLGRPE